jgi:hypothetical protein
VAETMFDVMARNIVDPRCDECGASVAPRDPLLGPHLCRACSEHNRHECKFYAREMSAWSGRRTSVHVVRLGGSGRVNIRRGR